MKDSTPHSSTTPLIGTSLRWDGAHKSSEPTMPLRLHAERAMAGDMLNAELDATSSEIREAAVHASDLANCLDVTHTQNAKQETIGRGEAQRHNAGKADLSLIPLHLLEGEARVWMHGEKKYSRWQWTKGMAWGKVVASLLRHLAAWQNGEELDPESGLPHLDHIACNVRMLQLYRTEYPEGDDRRKPNDTAKTTSNNPGHTDKAGSGY